MLSILIPTYNYNAYPLAKNLCDQATKLNINFEIIVMDDCSTEAIDENNLISGLPNGKLIKLSKNLGRSGIRNKLVTSSSYKNLIFLDSDTMPVNSNFVTNYLKALNDFEVVVGGIWYKKRAKNSQDLRYIYGIKRESLSTKKRMRKPYARFMSGSFAIRKQIFNTVSFDENHTGYGHEDTLFALDLKKNNISIHHINNPVYHLYSETGREFAIKTQSSIKNLKHYYEAKKITSEDVKLLKLYSYLNDLKLTNLVASFYKKNTNWFINRLSKNQPKLWIFDLYRIGYLCSIKNK